jgi:hypothetical protein
MTWTRLSDDFTRRAAIAGLSDAAFRAHIEAYCYGNAEMTDGRIPSNPRLLRIALVATCDVDAAVRELLEAELWTQVGSDYQLDWSEQEPAERVRERKAQAAKRQADFKERQHKHKMGDHSLCDPNRCNALRNASGNALPTALKTHPRTRPVPVPSRRDRDGDRGPRDEAQAPQPAAHQWTDDGSGRSCTTCGLPREHRHHHPEGEPSWPTP